MRKFRLTTTCLTEIWANIQNNPDYQVSNLGRVRSYKNNKLNMIKGWVQNTGYLTVALDNKKYSVHRLVAETFIHRPKEKNIVNHIDGNKLNNCINNLEWVTVKENVQHAFKIGLMDNAIEMTRQNKIRAKRIGKYDLEGNFICEYKGSVEAEKDLKKKNISVHARNIRAVCEGKRKKAGGYCWRYL